MAGNFRDNLEKGIKKGKEIAKKAVRNEVGTMAEKAINAASRRVGRFAFGRDPQGAFNFALEIDLIRCGSCQNVSGLEWSMEVESFYQGGENRHKVNLLGKGSFTPLKLKKGFFARNSIFFEWMQQMLAPNFKTIKRATVSVIILADDGATEIGRFNLYNAFMSKYTGPTLDTSSSQIAFEEIEIHYDYFEFIPFPGVGAGEVLARM